MKIMFFSPHAAIWLHAFPEALIAEALQQEGNEILYITCSGQLKDYCISMSAFGLSQDSSTQEKQKICDDCKNKREIIRKEFSFRTLDLKDALSESDHEAVANMMAGVTRDNFSKLSIGNLNIGTIALYELLLQFKKTDLIFSEVEWRGYLIALKNTLFSYYACRQIIGREQPQRVVLYNSGYSLNHICLQLAEASGIPGYFVHSGFNISNRLQTMIIVRGVAGKFWDALKDAWPNYKAVPCSLAELRNVTDHIVEIFKGRHFLAYSSPRKKVPVDVRSFFGIGKDKKIAVATMSSYDERMAAETCGIFDKSYELIFPKQVDWIKALIQWVKSREDLFLIIRVHPREFPNKRESVKSEHAKMLERQLKDLPENVRVNWPTDNMSLYDLAEETGVFLNAWSSVGEEMSLLGFPVVIYSPQLVLYPPDINYIGTSKKDFFEKIDQALKDGWSFERIRMTYRWYVIKLNRSVFNISESFSVYSAGMRRRSLLRRAFEKGYSKILGVFIPEYAHNEKLQLRRELEDCRHRAKGLKEKGRIASLIKEGKNTIFELAGVPNKEVVSFEQETEWIKQEVRRLGVASVNSRLSKISPGEKVLWFTNCLIRS